MYKGKTPSTPPSKERHGEDERGESKDEIIARLLRQNAEKDKAIADKEKTIADNEKTIADNEKTIADNEKTIADQEKAIADQYIAIAENKEIIAEQKRNVSKTKLLDFLCLVNERVYDEFTVETDRSQLAQGTTSVAGKFCPRRIRFWADFEGLHERKFQEIQDSLDPLDACFASPHDVSGFLSAFSPKSKNEATLRPFLRIALEKPAAAIVNEHLHTMSATPDSKTPSYVRFADEDKKTQTSRSSKSRLTSDTGGASIPDRVCVYDSNDEAKINVRFLVGEYKAAHRLTPPKLQQMLESPPEDYVIKAARIDEDLAPDRAPNDAVFSSTYPSVYLAKALCQAYHYMISGALEYGYIATGYALLMLHVVPDDLDTLHYYRVTFTPKGTQAPLHPSKTAAAYMSTLVLLALRDAAPSDAEIGVWARDRMVWPRVKYRGKRGDLTEPADPEDPDDGEGGGGGGGGGQGRSKKSKRDGGGGDNGPSGGSGSKRSRVSSASTVVFRKRHGGASDGASTAATQGRPLALDLPYCTQACLLGVVHQLPLDEKCPNVELHRAASLRKHGPPDGHPLTEAGLREALLVQAKAAETDMTQRCVPCGREGRYGALVHVAVACAGYGLVAKATYVSCVDGLEHELRVYNALKAYQGKLIPVCLGVMTFLSARFTSDCMMRSLLFLSYAGRDLGKPERLPLNINLQTAMDRTTKELYDLGLRNRDVRVYNCAWNPETRRVFHFDFDQATMAEWETKEAKEAT